jgi:hypothetical protein
VTPRADRHVAVAPRSSACAVTVFVCLLAAPVSGTKPYGLFFTLAAERFEPSSTPPGIEGRLLDAIDVETE